MAEQRVVDPADWLAAVRAARDEGFTAFGSVGAVDELGRRDTIAVVCHLRDWSASGAREVLLHTEVPRGRVPQDAGSLDSITPIFPGAAWYEREVHDFFGVHFVGDARWRLDEPLLNLAGGAPLRKDVPLAARAAIAWPGAKEPGQGQAAPSRRRMAPPGVPEPEVWGDRPPGAGPVTPDEVAASLAGGRVRRRRP